VRAKKAFAYRLEALGELRAMNRVRECESEAHDARVSRAHLAARAAQGVERRVGGHVGVREPVVARQ
jgi:hypothetical protein